MPRIGIIVGSLAKNSINKKVAQALVGLAPADAELTMLDFSELPLYSYDYDANYPQVAKDWKASIEEVDGIIIVTPEYSRSIPGALKNALDWASRPWGTNSFNGKPVAVMGASIGATGTAIAQQHLRTILAHLNAPTMGQPETFFQYNAAAFAPSGEIQDQGAAGVLQNFVDAAVAHVERNAREHTAA
ncbi:NADPH-dependent FMN reductase [Demequina lutea]|uniref:Chromate reductase n=1 Tax=Demequina lutea TaxID=431489 RepID=A0A7Z0CJF3_9MICO|nr:NAD(P)H-dependent oxidoreductase [Demequina lutea]NYI40843.1 chromate reductase [Demequina lutea]